MKARGPIWKVSISTTPEAEEAVTELLYNFFELPVSSYTDVETAEVTVATYLTTSSAKLRQVLECASPPALLKLRSKKRRRAAAVQDASALHEGLEQIKDYGLNIGSGKISVQKVRREDWAESWKRHFKPIEIGSALLIKPSWSKHPPKNGQAMIVLDPGLSFGTGQHPTTSFCLRQIAFRHQQFKRQPTTRSSPFVIRHSSLSFLDIGAGSGILAIAAAKLGYAPVEAFDFDPEAVRIARENARKNRVSLKVHMTRGDVTKLALDRKKKYDLICANLISTLLVAERSRILCRLKEDGVLVLAGILKVEFALIRRAYESAGLRLIASRTEKEWRSGAFAYRGRH
jgi:ribosomal protein L11 methyltransferase